MASYQSVEAGSTLPRGFKLVARASGNPITSGTVNHYLKALTGANAGKWFKASDNTWQASETANAMTHQADGSWSLALTGSPWGDGISYVEYAKESGDLHVPVDRWLIGEYTPSADSSRRVDLGKCGGSAVAAGAIPNAAAAASGGLPTVDGSNYVAGIQGAKNTLDSLNDLSAAGVRTAVGLSSANLDTQLTTLAGYLDTEIAAILAAVDTEVAAIKAKTDNLPASPAAAGDAMTLVDNAITAAKIAASAITAAKLATDAIGAAQLAADAIAEIQSGLSTLDAAGIRAAVGLGAANLDTQLDALPTAAELVTALNADATQQTQQANAATAATQSTAADTKAADIQSRLPAALSGGRIPAVLAITPPTAAEIDTQLSGTHGSGLWGASGATGAYTVTVTVVDEDTDLPLSQAQVTVRDSGGAVHHQERTDSSGEVSFPAGDDAYTVSVLGLPGYNGAANQAFAVDGADEAVEVRLAPIASGSAAPGTRIVRVIVVDPSGGAVADLPVTAHLLARGRVSVDQALVQLQTLSTTTDETGVADLTLITEGQFEEGDGVYVIRYGEVETKTSIPSGAGVLNLQEHLNPPE